MTQRVTQISGIGEQTEIALAEHGFKTVADVAKAKAEQLAVVKGFGAARADRAIAAAIALLKDAKGELEAQQDDASEEKEGLKKSKAKKSGKEKDKKKKGEKKGKKGKNNKKEKKNKKKKKK